MTVTKTLTPEVKAELLKTLKTRFEKNMNRHPGLSWTEIQERLERQPEKLLSIQRMEASEGEPDVVSDQANGTLLIVDCSAESPKGRRSLCYDHEALESRKEFKPDSSAITMAEEMGIQILSEEQYRFLQTLGKFDLKTSSWVLTPPEIRKLGGAIFCDRRYNQVFTYHNGASSYYAARGFRGFLLI